MILDVLTILNNDSALVTLLGGTAQDTKIYPYSAELKDKCIVYTLSPVSEEDIKKVDRLEIRTVCTDFGTAIAISDRVSTILKTIGDSANGDLLQVSVNGGGTLEDMKTGAIHIIKYYYITTKTQ